MLDQLFGSKVRVKILDFLFSNEGKKFYTQEIIKLSGTDAANAHRELIKLEDLGILGTERKANQKYYFLNTNSEYFDSLKQLLSVHHKKQIDDPWMLAEDIPDMDFTFSDIWMSGFVNEFEKPGGRAYKKLLSIYRGYHLWFYFGEQDAKDVADHLVNRMIAEPNFGREVNLQIINWSDKLRKYAEGMPEDNLGKLSNKQIWQIYKKHDEIHTHYYQWGWIPVGMDMFHPVLTNKLQDYLREIGVPEDKVNEYLVILTQPLEKSLIQIEREELLELALKISQDKYHKKIFWDLYHNFTDQEASTLKLQIHTKEYEERLKQKIEESINLIKPEFMKLIEQYYLKYFYVNRMWVGEISTLEHYIKQIVKLVGTDSNVKEILTKEEEEWQANIKKRNDLFKKLKIEGKWKEIFESFGDFMISKIYRRYAQLYALYKLEFLQREIARRLGLSLKQVRFMKIGEVDEALNNGKFDPKELYDRSQFCVGIFEKGKETIYTGTQAEKLAEEVEKVDIDTEVTELTGQTGCIGKATGTVKLIIRPDDMGKMQQGDILVSIATDPDIVPAMKKAAAIVTEQGGVTSHAAIVSRELNIPCVIGTKIATKVLKDGDRVEVDASQGLVKILT